MKRIFSIIAGLAVAVVLSTSTASELSTANSTISSLSTALFNTNLDLMVSGSTELVVVGGDGEVLLSESGFNQTMILNSINEGIENLVLDADGDGVFDDIQEYQKIVSYIVDKIGFNVKKDIPTLKDTQIIIVGVEPDNTITVKIEKNIGYLRDVKKYTLTFEQLISLLKNYQLFEI